MIWTGDSRGRSYRFINGLSQRKGKGSLMGHWALIPLLALGTLAADMVSLRLAQPPGHCTVSVRPWIPEYTCFHSVLFHAGKVILTHPHSAQTHLVHTFVPSSHHYSGPSLLTYSVMDFEICLLVSHTAKHRCSVFLNYFNHYLLGCSASEKGRPHHECLICSVFFFRNVIRYFSRK